MAGLLPLITDFIKGQVVPAVQANTTPFFQERNPQQAQPMPAQPQQDMSWYQMKPGSSSPSAESGSGFGSFGNFFNDPERMARMTLALNSMRLSPDAGIAAMANQQLKNAQEQRLLARQGNVTANALEKYYGRKDLADMVRNDPTMSKIALDLLKTNGDTEAIKTAKQAAELQGFKSGTPEYARFISNYLSKNPTSYQEYQLAKSSNPNIAPYDKWLEQQSAAKATKITLPGEKGDIAWEQGAAGVIAKRFEKLSNQGDVASSLRPELQTLKQLSSIAPNGPLVGRLAEALPGFSSVGDAFNSVISRVAPQMRVAGSGSQSDKDIDGLRASLGSLKNAPGANALIYQAFEDKVSIDQQRAEIANQALMGEITRSEASKQLSELNKKTIISPELQSMIDQYSGKTQEGQSALGRAGSTLTAVSIGAPTNVFDKMTAEQRAKYARMSPEQKARANVEILGQ